MTSSSNEGSLLGNKYIGFQVLRWELGQSAHTTSSWPPVFSNRSIGDVLHCQSPLSSFRCSWNNDQKYVTRGIQNNSTNASFQTTGTRSCLRVFRCRPLDIVQWLLATGQHYCSSSLLSNTVLFQILVRLCMICWTQVWKNSPRPVHFVAFRCTQ